LATAGAASARSDEEVDEMTALLAEMAELRSALEQIRR
jgi:hypothetical protein